MPADVVEKDGVISLGRQFGERKLDDLQRGVLLVLVAHHGERSEPYGFELRRRAVRRGGVNGCASDGVMAHGRGRRRRVVGAFSAQAYAVISRASVAHAANRGVRRGRRHGRRLRAGEARREDRVGDALHAVDAVALENANEFGPVQGGNGDRRAPARGERGVADSVGVVSRSSLDVVVDELSQRGTRCSFVVLVHVGPPFRL